MEKFEKLVLIDGNSIINRAFYALPLLTNSSGEFSNAVYGFCNILIKLIEQEKPKYVAVAFDYGKKTFRHELYADYKSGRKPMPPELACQLPILKQVLSAMNIKFVEKQGIEADDIIGTIAKKFDVPTIIVSGDRDLFQLVDDTTTVWFTKKGVTETINITPQNIKEVYGVSANNVVDLKALMGDSSDKIKGVAGIGEKTAKSLIEKYGTLDNIYKNIDDLIGKQKQKMIDGKEDAYLSKQLATIDTQSNIKIKLKDMEYSFPFGEQVLDLFKRYEFNSLLKKPDLFDAQNQQIATKQVNKNVVVDAEQLEKMLAGFEGSTELAIHFGQDVINLANSRFEENIIQLSQNLTLDYVLARLKNLLTSKSGKVVLNSKTTKTYLHSKDAQINNVCFDCNLAQYLLSGSQKTDLQTERLSALYGFADDCIATCLLTAKQDMIAELQKENMSQLYFDVELPLVDVLVDMEQTGFKIDTQNLQLVGENFCERLKVLTTEIWQIAGKEFNIKSPKQLDEVLFEHMQLKRPRGNKKSTDITVLEKIAYQSPIVEKIIEFRKLEKLFGTYIEPFEKLVDKQTGLIHTVFNQTLTSTGRLSSSEPNMQNIPVRDPEGKNLRKFFVPRDPAGCIVTCDYSQIELRLLAHYSGDPKLVSAYNQNIVDIHTKTASDIFGLPEEMITDELRRKAKTVNFGIIYGMSEYGLAQSLKIGRDEAKFIIEKYFETYSSVKDFMQSNVQKAKETGFVSTILGRKRKIDSINSPVYMTRQFGERAAMNMPLQGSASDLIKIAMVKVYNALNEQNLKSKLILQIHDELIVDCAAGEERAVEQILRDCMENAIKLNVPLAVDVKSGKTWFDAK